MYCIDAQTAWVILETAAEGVSAFLVNAFGSYVLRERQSSKLRVEVSAVDPATNQRRRLAQSKCVYHVCVAEVNWLVLLCYLPQLYPRICGLILLMPSPPVHLTACENIRDCQIKCAVLCCAAWSVDSGMPLKASMIMSSIMEPNVSSSRSQYLYMTL